MARILKDGTVRLGPFDEGYHPTYDPSVEGYGNAAKWRSIFTERFTIVELNGILKGRNPRTILGVSVKAAFAECRKAYRTLARVFHPDMPTGDEEKFKEIQAAYEAIELEYGFA